MFEGKKASHSKIVGTIGRNIKRSSSGMAFESKRAGANRTSSLVPQIVCPAASFEPWSLKIPLGDGYHENLCSAS
ncbi:unnamed protein product [Spirodela intermedia]|uniref:Uncharacterized protein n=1 Tax=Spirodela intermedia TaxID=51605 RepID=A0A7I8JG42_SPIIN|nr:unnamed protein product [Spirodela intermedia]CAA6668362.1 unnamed protein product [Spirodela intermedia]